MISTGTLTITAGTFDTGNNWSLTITSNVVVNGGTFNLNNSTLSVQRDWTFSSGVLNASGSTVTFTGANATQNITSNGSSFTNLLINKSGGSLLLQDALDINGIFTNTLGTFNTNTKAISAGGNWNFTAGTFTGAGSTVTFSSATRSTLTGATPFYALQAITPNTTLYFTAGSTQYVTGLVDLENISLHSTTNNATWWLNYSGSDRHDHCSASPSKTPTPTAISALLPDGTSVDGGNNRKLDFGASKHSLLRRAPSLRTGILRRAGRIRAAAARARRCPAPRTPLFSMASADATDN